LIQSGRTIAALRMDGRRIAVGYPEDRDRAAERLTEDGEEASSEEVDTTG
jgi:glucose-1-phosphate thymidylyltransferase